MAARPVPSSFGPIRLASRALAFASSTCFALARPLRRTGLAVLRPAGRAPILAPRPFLREMEVPSGNAGYPRRRRGSELGLLWAPPSVCPQMPEGTSVSRKNSCPGGAGGVEGARPAGRSPILVLRPSFDGYSSTFRDLSSRPAAGSALACGNAGQIPRSTRGVVKSIRITEKVFRNGRLRTGCHAAAGPCPAMPAPAPDDAGAARGLAAPQSRSRLATDATVPTKSGPESVGTVASVVADCRERGVGG